MIERYGLEHYQEHLRKIKEYSKQYHRNHREELIEYHKRYYQNHREKYSEYRTEYGKQYYQTQYGRAAHLLYAYRQMDELKGVETDLTPEWVIENIFKSKCYYCEEADWTKLGTDRIDNTKGHTMDNCICACGKCNVERGDRYSVEEFKRYKQIRPKIA